MRNISIMLAVVGFIVIIGGSIFYKKDTGPVGSAATRENTRAPEDTWAPKIPALSGGILIALGIVFYVISRTKAGNSENLR
jgi:hypothetical protein